MNDRSDQEIDDLLLERLVDGELTEAEYRNLLAELDQRHDGWRRCAMAFLEDQAWGRELRGVRRQLDEPIVRPTRISRIRWAWNFGGFLTLACAASFLLMYLLATSVIQFRNSQVAPKGDLVARAPANGKSDTVLADSSPAENANMSVGEYVVDGPSGRIQMPIYPANDPRAGMVMDERASMPVEFMRDVQRSGYEVERQRQWAIGEDAGNSVLVPIEELQIRPISGQSFH